MYDDYLIKHEIAKINVSSIISVFSQKYADNFSEIDGLLFDYMEANGLTPESTITCQECIDLLAKADNAMFQIMTKLLSDVLTQIWLELSQGSSDA